MDAPLPLTLTSVHGYSATAAGIPLTFGALGWAAASNLQGVVPRPAAGAATRAGAALLAFGLAGTALAALPALGGWPAYPFWAVAGPGWGWGCPASGSCCSTSPWSTGGRGLAALQIADVTASALCIGLAGILVAAATAGLVSLPAADRRLGRGVHVSSRWPSPLLAGRPPRQPRACPPPRHLP